MKKLLFILTVLAPVCLSTAVFAGQHSGLGGGSPPSPPPPVDPKPEVNRNVTVADALLDWVKEQMEVYLQDPEAKQ